MVEKENAREVSGGSRRSFIFVEPLSALEQSFTSSTLPYLLNLYIYISIYICVCVLARGVRNLNRLVIKSQLYATTQSGMQIQRYLFACEFLKYRYRYFCNMRENKGTFEYMYIYLYECVVVTKKRKRKKRAKRVCTACHSNHDVNNAAKSLPDFYFLFFLYSSSSFYSCSYLSTIFALFILYVSSWKLSSWTKCVEYEKC